MKFGYTKVSKIEQNSDLQIQKLKKAGCERIFTDDQINSSDQASSGLEKIKEHFKKGDTLIFFGKDLLEMSLGNLIDWFIALEAQGVELQTLTEESDVISSSDKFLFHMFNILAEFKRNFIREGDPAEFFEDDSTRKPRSRRKKLDDSKRELVIHLYKERQKTVTDICKMMGISRPTLYKYLKDDEQEKQKEESFTG